MKTTILGIRIPLPTEQTEWPELGIYTNEIRWSEAALVGVAEQWTAGLIAPDGIGEFIQRADLRRGGGPAIVDATTVTVDNTDQLILKFQELGIYLDGLTAIIEEFEGTTEDSDSEYRETVSTGEIENLSWDERRLQVWVNSSLSRQRRANIGTVVNSTNRDDLDERMEGKIVPVSFGVSGPDNRRYFKLLRTSTRENVLAVENIAQFDGNYYPPKMNLFPAFPNYGPPDPLIMNIRIGYYGGITLTPEKGAELIGKYILIVEGPVENRGVYRKITDVVVANMGAGEHMIEITMRDYLPVDVTGNETGTGEDQTWVQLVDTDRTYEADVAECEGFESEPVLYTEKGGQIIQIPPYGLNINVLGNNRLEIDPLHFRENPNNLSSFLVVPAVGVERYTADDLGGFVSAEEPWWGNYEKVEAGLYGGYYGTLHAHTFTNPENALDRKHGTYCEWVLDIEQTVGLDSYFKVLKIVLPPAPIQFTRAYMGIKMWSKSAFAYGIPLRIRRRAYINRGEDVISKNLKEADPAGAIADCIPDFYYSPAPETNNQNFFRVAEDVSGAYPLVSGHTEFPITDKLEDYNNIEEVALLLERSAVYNNRVVDETKIYQIAVIFETTADIEEAVYV